MILVSKHKKALYKVFTLIGICLSIIFLAEAMKWIFPKTSIIIDDYSTFWAAGRLNLSGGNPYSNEDMVHQLREIMPAYTPDVPMITFYPPWVLPIIMPFGMLEYSISRMLWFGLNIIVIVFCADRAWLLYKGRHPNRWISWIIALTTLQTFNYLIVGNISAIVLLGVIGFLSIIQNERRDILSGAFISLCMIKPHLVYLFLFAILLWVIESKRWRVFLGFILTLLVLTCLALIVNPEVLWQYWLGPGHFTPAVYTVPTIGSFVRQFFFSGNNFWIQYLPTFAGGLWFLFYWKKHHNRWHWLEMTPLLILLSIIAAPFAWSFDQVVLILSIIQVFTWLIYSKHEYRAISMVLIYLVFQILYLFTIIRLNEFWTIWMAPALLLWYSTNSIMEKQEAPLTNSHAVQIS